MAEAAGLVWIGLGMVTRNLTTGVVDLMAIPKILLELFKVEGVTTLVRLTSFAVFPSI